METTEKSKLLRPENKNYDCFACKSLREGFTVWVITFALGFRLYIDTSSLKIIPKAKIYSYLVPEYLFYLIAKLTIAKNL